MDKYGEIIEKMSKFLEEEPSGNFTAIDRHNDGIIWHEALRSFELEKMAKFSNNFDDSKELTLIYLSEVCKYIIENTTCPVSDALVGSPQLEKYRKCLALTTSKEVLECHRAFVDKMAQTISIISKHRLIGKESEIGEDVDNAIGVLFETFANLNFEIYQNSGKPIGHLATTALSVQACNSLAECLLRLEKSPDGIYVCYISNPGTLDGWFGFFVKSNGNLFSYHERIDEAYIGQHGNMRNGRYAENKAYDLFPYELCKASEETDYKGYAKEIRIGEQLNLAGENGDDFGIVIRMLLSMAVIARKHSGKTIDGEPVIVNSLLPNNLALLADRESAADTTAVVEWKGSPIVEYTAKTAAPTFDVSKVLNGEYDKEFNDKWKCWFTGANQDIVDVYGEGFEIQQDKILSSNSSLRLIGNGESEQEFIGTKERLRVQAYYEVRKQLCNYIGQKMQDEYDDFGGYEELGKWCREKIETRKPEILKYCLDAFDSIEQKEDKERYLGALYLNSDNPDKSEGHLDGRFGDQVRAVCIDVYNKPGIEFWGVRMMSQYDGDARKHRCWLTGKAASYYFLFSFSSYHQVKDFLGCELPKFCTGWYRDHRYVGNPILDIVDPVSQMITPLEEKYHAFDFAVALSKSAINKIKKEANYAK
jgi:hypothetical protein